MKYRIDFLEKEKGIKKSLGALSQTVNSASASDQFLVVLERELESLSQGRSPLKAKRDEIHRLAKRFIPNK